MGLRMRTFDKYLSMTILAFLVACSGDDSTSGNDIESSDDSYSLEVSSSSVGSVPSSSEESSSSGLFVVDERDGQTYKTVKINNQTWMAENLNYAYLQPTEDIDSSSWCYDNDPENCKKYGRLYLWSAAMDSAALFSEGGKGCGKDFSGSLHNPPCYNRVTRGVCPEGWHVPTDGEFNELVRIAENRDSLKSSTGWEDGYNGSDHYGFNAIPAGAHIEIHDVLEDTSWYDGVPTGSGFWTSAFKSVKIGKYLDALDEYAAYSIRCIKD